MLDSKPLLFPSTFPVPGRGALRTLQVNLGYRCNQQCQHCHVNAGPKRTETMNRETVDDVLGCLREQRVGSLDLTGGAPELNAHFRYLVEQARGLGCEVIDRCNLTILEEPDQRGLAAFLAAHHVRVVASMPCYLPENVDRQRGAGVYAASIRALQRLNRLGYGVDGSGLRLDLVYNPLGPTLPPAQSGLEMDYKQRLFDEHGIVFDHLLTLTNAPVSRFGSMLQSTCGFEDYLRLLKDSFHAPNLESLMCRDLLSVDWRGRVYDCDFNQMLDLPLEGDGKRGLHVRDLKAAELRDLPIQVGEHCWACAAGQGSSCGGALS